MKKKHQFALVWSLAIMVLCNSAIAENTIFDAIGGGKTYGNFNLRLETVEQDNGLQNATALTLRTRLGYTSAECSGFSGQIEFEDSRIVGDQNEFTVGPAGFNPGVYSVIADPETTELDQFLLQYKNDLFTAKVGRQVIALDGQRFVGHVGWRQDRQTFDGVTLKLTPSKNLSVLYAFVNQRNRIFAEAANIASEDHLFNLSYTTPLGKLGAYAYLLEVDNNTNNSRETFGVSLSGKKSSFLYAFEYATQEAEAAAASFDADYLFGELGLAFNPVTLKVGYELLGSDNGGYGFTTELATLHKFNGWSDQFLGTPGVGLEDIYISVAGKLAGGNWLAAYHEFSADESSPTIDDLGDEINLQYTRKFFDKLTLGLKYASYGAGDPALGKVDADKFWFWLSTGF